MEVRLEARSGTCRPSTSKQEDQSQRRDLRLYAGGHYEVKAKETTEPGLQEQ